MTEPGANEELFSIIIVSKSIKFALRGIITLPYLCNLGFVVRLGRQDATRVCNIFYKTVRAGTN